MNLSWRNLVDRVLPNSAASKAQELAERRSEARVPSQISVKLRWEDGELVQETTGVAENVSENGFSILTAEPISIGQTVWVVGRSVTGRKAVVRYCQASESGYNLGVRAISRDRRRIDRQPVDGAGVLRFGDSRGHTVKSEVVVKNISNGGMQLQIGVPAEKETYVRLTGESLECEGTVRYCQQDGESYLLGVQFIREPGVAVADEDDPVF